MTGRRPWTGWRWWWASFAIGFGVLVAIVLVEWVRLSKPCRDVVTIEIAETAGMCVAPPELGLPIAVGTVVILAGLSYQPFAARRLARRRE